MTKEEDNILRSINLWSRNTGWFTTRIAQSIIMVKDDVIIRICSKKYFGRTKRKWGGKYTHYFDFRVVTDLNHPTKGRTLLERKVRTMNAVQTIMYYPRVHSGKGKRIK